MYKYLNLNPNGKLVGDCVKRAIAKAEERDYLEVKRDLNKVKRELNDSDLESCRHEGAKKKYKSTASRKVWKEYIKRKKYQKISFKAVAGERRMNGYSFMESYPQGHYVLQMAHHLTACVDGDIYDTWNCLDKCVYVAYKID